jgi:hypothetical protein
VQVLPHAVRKPERKKPYVDKEITLTWSQRKRMGKFVLVLYWPRIEDSGELL